MLWMDELNAVISVINYAYAFFFMTCQNIFCLKKAYWRQLNAAHCFQHLVLDKDCLDKKWHTYHIYYTYC